MLRVAKECRERRVEDGPLGKVHNYRKIRGGESEETRRGVFWKDEENSREGILFEKFRDSRDPRSRKEYQILDRRIKIETGPLVL